MCCKKWVGGLAAVVLLVLGLSLFGATEPGRFVYGHAWVQVQKLFGWIDKQVPLEDEIARIGNEVDGLSKDMAAEYDKVASQRREVKALEKDIVARRSDLDGQEKLLDKLNAYLEQAESKGDKFITIEGKTSEVPVVRADFADRWNDFMRGKDILQKKEALLQQNQKLLDKMNENLKNLAHVQEDLKLKLKDLQTQLDTAHLAQAQKDLDRKGAVSPELDARLKHINESMDKVQVKIEDMVDQAKADAGRPAFKPSTGIAERIKADTALDGFKKYKENKVAVDK